MGEQWHNPSIEDTFLQDLVRESLVELWATEEDYRRLSKDVEDAAARIFEQKCRDEGLTTLRGVQQWLSDRTSLISTPRFPAGPFVVVLNNGMDGKVAHKVHPETGQGMYWWTANTTNAPSLSE